MVWIEMLSGDITNIELKENSVKEKGKEKILHFNSLALDILVCLNQEQIKQLRRELEE